MTEPLPSQTEPAGNLLPLPRARPHVVAATPLEETVAIVGIGLIGGSLAAAIKKRGLAKTVIGVGRNESRLRGAQLAGLIDSFTLDVAEAAAQANLLIFCTPVDRIASGVLEAAKNAHPGLLISDAGSTKSSICRELETCNLSPATFLGAHPIAGSHEKGYEAANADLFDGRVCVITPTANSRDQEIQRLSIFWRQLGSTVHCLSPEEHDAALAQTSHLPHVVASALSGILEARNHPYVGTGFRGTTRIAASDPDLWVSILQSNAECVRSEIGRVIEQLERYQQALSSSNPKRLRDLFAAGQEIRRQITPAEESP